MSFRKIAGFILAGILLSINNTFGQDTIQWTRHLRFGFDLSRITMGEFQSQRKGLEFTMDAEVKPNLFYTVEIGHENSLKDNERIRYKASGIYGRIGFDYNMLSYAKTKSRDLIYVGARYGYYNMKHQSDWFMIPNNTLRGDTITGSYPSKNLFGHWIEGVFGIKVEMFKNFYLGTSLRVRFLIYTKKDINYPYYMPGFGDGSQKATFGLTYTMYYQFPVSKSRQIITKKEE